MCEYEYVGCFFDFDEFSALVAPLRRGALSGDKKKPHITFQYMPESVNPELFGQEIEVTVLGYGNNGVNEGLKVSLRSENPEINRMIEKIAVPHITIAVSESGQAVDTKYLEFAEIEPFTIKGHFGGHIDI